MKIYKKDFRKPSSFVTNSAQQWHLIFGFLAPHIQVTWIVIGPFWIKTKMDNYVCHDLMKEEIFAQLWFMQDGATCHTTENNLSFLKQKFSGRLISNKSEVPWPPSSPDCNPLNFFFWGYVMQHVYINKPTSIADLKAVVEDFV